MNLLGGIFNDSENVDDQEDYGFRGLFFKIAPTVVDYYTKKKFLNMQLEHLRPQINIENNDGYLKIIGKCYFLNFHKLKNNFMSQDNNL